MLKVNNLSLSLGNNTILENVSFDLKENEFLTILGPNGSGKSTLIKSLCGIYRNFSGEARILDRSIIDISQKELATSVSYVPQFLEIHADYSVWDFMEMSYFPHLDNFRGLVPEEIDRAHEILERFNLVHLKSRSMTTLSGGERQKVFIASSIFQNPRLLLLDEPTSYLDPKHQDEVNEIIFSLKEEMAVIMVSHDINTSLLNSSRVMGMKNGSVLFDSSPKEMISNQLLDKLFDKEFSLTIHPQKNIQFVVPRVFDEN
ncbi:ABC transporter ATP-binding protein [Halobacteriovorax sp. HLS]|uniref:ABC transporter ATP-binding protein n=1 Tax=Halobacteriovorax sp. HLS TaxID=2234000 RepID=UPI000FDB68E5|nr:ABC transporter ATP-binding protein [Halobacteriovorax sp. HLS]